MQSSMELEILDYGRWGQGTISAVGHGEDVIRNEARRHILEGTWSKGYVDYQTMSVDWHDASRHW